jgi:hypothetical protein
MPKYIMTVEATMKCHTTVTVEAEDLDAAMEIAAEEAISFEPVSSWDYTQEDYEVTNVQKIKESK